MGRGGRALALGTVPPAVAVALASRFESFQVIPLEVPVPPGPFAAILLAGGLDRVLDPAALLASAAAVLAPGGAVIATAGNVAYGPRRLALLSGESRWSPADGPGLRFDRAALERLFVMAGLAIRTWRRIPGAPLAGASTRGLSAELVDELRDDQEARTERFVVKAVAGAVGSRPPASPAPAAWLRSAARLAPAPDELAEPALRRALADFLASPDARIVLTTPAAPCVSVLLVTHQRAERTLRCLRALEARAGEVPFEVILVDNASTDATPELLQRISGPTVLRNPENHDLLRACNQAAREARGEYLLLLANDTYVTEGAIAALARAAGSRADVGAVAARLVSPDGKLLEAGAIVWRDGSTFSFGRGGDPERGEYLHPREVDYGSGAALLVRRSSWTALGGLDERFAPACYDDADLGLALRARGERVLYEPRAVVVHEERSSGSRKKAATLMSRNRSILEAKWRDALRGHEPPLTNLVRSHDRRSGERILVLDDRVPVSSLGSGYPRMVGLLRSLVELGYLPTVIPVCDQAPVDAAELEPLRRLGVEILDGPRDVACELAARRGLVRRVIVSRLRTAEVALPLVREHLPDALVVYDAEALSYRREELRVAVTGAGPRPQEIAALARRELEAIAGADTAILVSSEEVELAVERGAPRERLVEWGYPVEPRRPATPFADRRDLLFVGGFAAAGSPNEDAIVEFARAVLPRIRERLPDVRLHIVGARPTASVLALASSAIVVHGRAADLGEHYEGCRVFVNPLRFGAGIPLKLAEALAHGIPAVAVPLAARALGLVDGVDALVASNDEEFAASVVRLHEDESLWTRLQEGALAGSSRRGDRAALGRALAAALAREPGPKPSSAAPRRSTSGASAWPPDDRRAPPPSSGTPARRHGGGGARGVLRRIARTIPPVRALYDELWRLTDEVEELRTRRRGAVPGLERSAPMIPGSLRHEVPGVDLREEAQLELLGKLERYYPDMPFRPEKVAGLRYFFENADYSYSDAIFLHCLLRHVRPKRVIVVGCGNSSCALLDTSERFLDGQPRITFLGPSADLLESLVSPAERARLDIRRTVLQDLDPSLFDELGPGDVLFVDTSNFLETGTDANWVFGEVLPRIRPGVLVHVHRIFYPFEYPIGWVRPERSWNECYAMRSFLQFNASFRIVIWNAFLEQFHEERLAKTMPLCLEDRGGGIWIERVA
jgi:GT2 family glycosyltransferase